MKANTTILWLKILVCTIFSVLLFLFDIFLELGIAFGMNYIFLVLLSIWIGRKSSFVFAGIATVLIVAGWYLSPIGGYTNTVLLNRLFSITTIWAVALIIEYFLRNKETNIQPKQNLVKFAKKRFVGIAILTFFIGSVILSGIYVFQANVISDKYIKNQHEEFSKIGDDATISLNQLFNDVLFLSKLESVETFDRHKEEVEADFSNLASLRGYYDQIRIIGYDGQEELRVNNSIDAPIIVRETELQDKRKRPYFKEAISLNKNEVYISAVDANMENGEMEVPIKPVVRIVTPIFDAGKPKGILVINYLVNEILEDIVKRKFDSKLNSGDRVLNQDGLQIAEVQGDDSLLFIELKLKKEYPIKDKQLWRSMKKQQIDGSFKNGDYVLHLKIDFLESFQKSQAGTVSSNLDPSIIILRTIPFETIQAHKHANFKTFIAYYILYFIVFLISTVILWKNKNAKHQAESKFESLFNGTFQFIGLLSTDGILLEANHAMLEFSGSESGDILGKKLWETPLWSLNEESRTKLIEAIKTAGNGEFIRYDVDLKGKDSIQSVDFSLLPVFDANGNVEYIIPEARDITEIKSLHSELLGTNKLFEEVQQVARIGYWKVDLAKNTALWSDTVYEIHEVELGSEIKVEEGINFYRKDYQPIIQSVIGDAIENNKSWDVEAVLVATSKKEIWVRAIGYPVFENGELKELRGLFMDIDNTKRESLKLEESEERVKKLNEELEEKVARQLIELNRTKTELEQQLSLINSNAIISIRGLDQKWASINQHFCETSGYTNEELIGKNYDFIAAERDVGICSKIKATITKGEIWKGEINLQRKDGTTYWVNSFIKPFFNEEGEIERYVEVSFDITRIRESEERIKIQSKKLKTINRELDGVNKELETFSYSVSHDLKAPLRALQGFSRNLQIKYDDLLDDTGKRWLDFIAKNAESMDNLIKSILSFSRINKQELAKSEIDMKRIVSDKVEVQKLIYQNELEITIGELPTAIGDYSMLELVWQNLIGNAFKYSSKNEVIKIEIQGTVEDEFISYSITDKGAGFDMRHYESVFGLFQRAHGNDEFEGTGVGLANVVRIISKHEGEITAESEPGKGAQFIFKLPKT